MALSLLFDNLEVKTPFVTFDEDSLLFSVTDSDKAVEWNIQYTLEAKTDYLTDDFQLVFLHNAYLYAENDIFEIYLHEEDTRIGWIIPLQALMSNEHDKSGNAHFLKYAFVAFHKLLKNQEEFESSSPSFSPTSNYTLNDFFPKDIIILVICNQKINVINDFSIYNFLPSLANYGYYTYKPKDNKVPIENYPDIEKYFNAIRLNRGRITLKNSCNFYKENFYVNELYKNLLNTVLHPLMRFHYLYQIIEIMLEEIYESEFNRNLSEYSENKLTRNDLREKLIKLDERKRLKKIFNENGLDNSLKIDLEHECKKILFEFKNDDSTQTSDLLYDLRNLVTHNFHKFTGKQEHLNYLDHVNFRFELLLNALLINFQVKKIPKPPTPPSSNN